MQAIILDQKLKALVQTERKITHDILLLIQTLDIAKSYRELGYSSLFEYLVKEIGYSESAAQRRISSARLMKEVASVKQDLQSETLNLTQVSLAQTAIRQEEKAQGVKLTTTEKSELLLKLQYKNSYDTKKILKEALPSFEIPQPKALPGGNQKVHITMQMSETDWAKVQMLLAHFSHSVPDRKIESLLLLWAEQVEIKKLRQAEKQALNNRSKEMKVESTPRQQATEIPIESPAPCVSTEIQENPLPLRQPHTTTANRKTVPNGVKIQVRSKAQDQCEYISKITGQRCASKHFLEIEHSIPRAQGGSNDLKNLRLYCRPHNALMAKAWGLSNIRKQRPIKTVHESDKSVEI